MAVGSGYPVWWSHDQSLVSLGCSSIDLGGDPYPDRSTCFDLSSVSPAAAQDSNALAKLHGRAPRHGWIWSTCFQGPKFDHSSFHWSVFLFEYVSDSNIFQHISLPMRKARSFVMFCAVVKGFCCAECIVVEHRLPLCDGRPRSWERQGRALESGYPVPWIDGPIMVNRC